MVKIMKKNDRVFSLLIIFICLVFAVSGCSLPFDSDGRQVIRIALDKNYIETGNSSTVYHSKQDILYGVIIYSIDSKGKFNYVNNSDEDPDGIDYSFSKKEAKKFFELIDSYGLEEYKPFSLTEKNELITEFKSKTICIGDEIVIKNDTTNDINNFNYSYYTSENYKKIVEEFENLKNRAK